MGVSHFTELEVWQKAHALFLELVPMTDSLPSSRAVNIICDQLLRSCGSISANIAEGFNRSRRKFLSSLDIAVGEANETENWLLKIRDLDLIDDSLAEKHIDTTKTIGRMVNGLIRSLKAKEL